MPICVWYKSENGYRFCVTSESYCSESYCLAPGKGSWKVRFVRGKNAQFGLIRPQSGVKGRTGHRFFHRGGAVGRSRRDGRGSLPGRAGVARSRGRVCSRGAIGRCGGHDPGAVPAEAKRHGRSLGQEHAGPRPACRCPRRKKHAPRVVIPPSHQRDQCFGSASASAKLWMRETKIRRSVSLQRHSAAKSCRQSVVR